MRVLDFLFPYAMARLSIKRALGLPWWASGKRTLAALRERMGEEEFGKLVAIHRQRERGRGR